MGNTIPAGESINPKSIIPSLANATPPKKIAIFGSGSFGTALGALLARNGMEVYLLTRSEEVVDSVTRFHRNPQCPFPDTFLPYNLRATTSPSTALSDADYILHCIPVQASEEALMKLKDYIDPKTPIINCSKGLHTETLELMTALIPRVLGRPQPLAVLSGPTFAKELIQSLPSAAVIASEDIELAERVAEVFSCPTFRVFTSSDVAGVEVAGALKNVYAIAAGCSEGLGLGTNALAFLCTRAVAEMNHLAKALGSTETTLAGLAGVGDLMLTCWGALSRNRSVGVKLGQGIPLSEIMSTQKEVAEGVFTAPAALALAHKLHVDVPIIEAVVSCLNGKNQPLTTVMTLMSLPTGREKIL